MIPLFFQDNPRAGLNSLDDFVIMMYIIYTNKGTMEKVAVISRDPSFRRELASLLPGEFGADISEAHIRDRIVFIDIDTVRPGVIRELVERNLVVAVTRGKETAQVMEAAASGAFGTLRRPLDSKTLSRVVGELSDLRGELRKTVKISPPPPSAATCVIVGHSPVIREVCQKLARLSQADVPVLITGETGTGKELVAESIAQLSSRFGKPFVVVNCAAMPEALLESELFGFEKGAFTGAVAAKEGILRIADGGCVFFDEIGELPLQLQGKLLRFLQTQAFYPIGSTREVQVDVRVISATNRDLSAMVREGRFREDLYHRLRVGTIHVPPLRERKNDILPLVHFFLDRHHRTGPRPVLGFTRDFLGRLIAYDWPGNIRELENTIRSAIALSKTPFLTTMEIQELGLRSTARKYGAEGFAAEIIQFAKAGMEKKEPGLYEKIHSEVDRHLIGYVLSAVRENQSEAARVLGINRLTLRKRLGI